MMKSFSPGLMRPISPRARFSIARGSSRSCRASSRSAAFSRCSWAIDEAKSRDCRLARRIAARLRSPTRAFATSTEVTNIRRYRGVRGLARERRGIEGCSSRGSASPAGMHRQSTRLFSKVQVESQHSAITSQTRAPLSPQSSTLAPFLTRVDALGLGCGSGEIAAHLLGLRAIQVRAGARSSSNSSEERG